MSQSKSVKATVSKIEEDNNEKDFKLPTERPETPHLNGTDNHDDGRKTPDLPKTKIQTRSRSKTPLLKPPEMVAPESKPSSPPPPGSPSHNHNTRSRSKTPQNKILKDDDELANLPVSVSPEHESDIVDNNVNVPQVTPEEINATEMDSLADKDEDIVPELEFDENDIDVESEGSPTRCKTRRSQATSVSTPKTPKILEDEEFIIVDVNEIPDHDNSDTQSSLSVGNISTTAVAGSDITRNVDFTQDSELCDESVAYFTSPDRSITLRDTIKNISPRRTIRQVNPENYRKYALVNNRFKNTDVQATTADYDEVQRVTGIKRKSSSVQLNEPKKFKESPGLLSYITLPIFSLKNSFSASSKTNVLDYDKKQCVSDNVIKIEVDGEGKVERKWCSIM